MSLQGTFDTLSVTELFGLLSTAGKTGALRLEAGGQQASILVRAGRCCAVDDDATVPVETEAQLGTRLVDLGFTLARQAEGSFRFSDTDIAESGLSVAFEPAVTEITEMLAAWKDIEATLPSLDVRLGLAAALPDEQIVIRAGEWALLTQLSGRPNVRELVASAGEPLLDVCRRVKDLVDRGAIEVVDASADAPVDAPVAGAPVAEPPRPAAKTEPVTKPEPDPEPRYEELPPVETHRSDPRHRGERERSALEEATSRLLDPIEPYAPEADESDSERRREPVAVAADRPGGTEEASTDRGALLRLFSALKE